MTNNRIAMYLSVVCVGLVVPVLAIAPGRGWAADDYQLGPDSMPQPGVPVGEVAKDTWRSDVFPGTVRDYWVYVPRQYDPNVPA